MLVQRALDVAHGNFWTIAPHFRDRLLPPTPPSSEVVDVDVASESDDVPIRLRCHLARTGPDDGTLVILVHGLGGSSDSSYVWRGAAEAARVGWSSLRVNLRGADGVCPDFYHGGLTEDLDRIVAAPAIGAYRRIYILGYSMGGHVTLRYATEAPLARVEAVAAVCAPVDLAATCAALDRRRRSVYRHYLLRSLVAQYRQVASRRPVATPVARAAKIRTFREWDDLVVAPRHGFDSAEHYYREASVSRRLDTLRLPALMVWTEHDPMVVAGSVKPFVSRRIPRAEMRWLSDGGHVGFREQRRYGGTVEEACFAWFGTEGSK